jgi:hypothetical protein
MTLADWSSFVEVAVEAGKKFPRLFGDAGSKDIEEYLAFHQLNENLHVLREEDGWAFMVVRPIRETSPGFKWTNPDSKTWALSVLCAKSKGSVAALIGMFNSRRLVVNKHLYYRNGALRRWTNKITGRFLYGRSN